MHHRDGHGSGVKYFSTKHRGILIGFIAVILQGVVGASTSLNGRYPPSWLERVQQESCRMPEAGRSLPSELQSDLLADRHGYAHKQLFRGGYDTQRLSGCIGGRSIFVIVIIVLVIIRALNVSSRLKRLANGPVYQAMLIFVRIIIIAVLCMAMWRRSFNKGSSSYCFRLYRPRRETDSIRESRTAGTGRHRIRGVFHNRSTLARRVVPAP